MTPRRLLPWALLVLWACAAGQAPADEGDYPDLTWKLRRDLRDVQAVFPHPTDPLLAWLVTPAGLLKTDDDGKTFQAIPSASFQKVGHVSFLSYCPADENTLVFGTRSDGLFLSTDGGQTWRGMSTVQEPLADLHIECVRFCPADPSFRTVIASHGPAAAGLSITRNLGRNWEFIARGQYIKQFVKNGETIVAAASEFGTEGRVWGIHRSGTDGQRWEVCNRGIRPTEGVSTRGRWRFLFATLDGSILESNNDGRTWFPALELERSGWVSLFFTHGRTGNLRLLGAYDPRRQGLVMSTQRMAQGLRHKENRGLYVGPFVKSGASCRANANGTTYYVCMNNALWVGRRLRPKAGPLIAYARCRPSAVWIGQAGLSLAQTSMHRHIQQVAANGVRRARVRAISNAYGKMKGYLASMGFSVEAKIEHPRGQAAVASVTVDASSFGSGRTVQLHDDGKHEDGAAGDGLYAASVSFTSSIFQNAHKRRWPLPGKTALTVTATDKAKKTDSWSAVVSIHSKPAKIVLWGWGGGSYRRYHREGPAISAGRARNQGIEPGSAALSFGADGPGYWRGAWFWADGGINIGGRDNVLFQIKGDVHQELFVQLVDHHKIGLDVFDEPHYGHRVPLIAGGYLKQITPRYQQVRIPIAKLLPKGTYFLRMHCAGLALSAPTGGKPGRYYLDQVWIEP